MHAVVRKRRAATLLLAVCCLLTISPTRAAPKAVDGRAYIGTLNVRAERHDGPPMRRSGQASAQFQRGEDNHSRLVVYGELGDGNERPEGQAGDAGFVLDGRVEAGAWRGGSDDFELIIASDGAIRGGGEAGGDDHRIEGQVDERHFTLTTTITPAPGSRSHANGFMRFVFEYQLEASEVDAGARTTRRDAARPSPESRPRKTLTCKTIGYQTRWIANPFGSTMSTVQVPVCLP